MYVYMLNRKIIGAWSENHSRLAVDFSSDLLESKLSELIHDAVTNGARIQKQMELFTILRTANGDTVELWISQHKVSGDSL